MRCSLQNTRTGNAERWQSTCPACTRLWVQSPPGHLRGMSFIQYCSTSQTSGGHLPCTRPSWVIGNHITSSLKWSDNASTLEWVFIPHITTPWVHDRPRHQFCFKKWPSQGLSDASSDPWQHQLLCLRSDWLERSPASYEHSCAILKLFDMMIKGNERFLAFSAYSAWNRGVFLLNFWVHF